jgi:hypothetical protein
MDKQNHDSLNGHLYDDLPVDGPDDVRSDGLADADGHSAVGFDDSFGQLLDVAWADDGSWSVADLRRLTDCDDELLEAFDEGSRLLLE